MYVATHVAIQEYYVMFTYCFGLCDHTPTRVGHMGRLDSLRPSGAYICVSYLAITGSDNGLSSGRRQAIM